MQQLHREAEEERGRERLANINIDYMHIFMVN